MQRAEHIGPAVQSPSGAGRSGAASPTTWLFNRLPVLKNSPFRTGLAFWLLFMTSFVAAECVFYVSLQHRILASVDESLRDIHARAEAEFKARGIAGVVAMAETTPGSPMAPRTGFHLATADGERLAGNVPTCITQLGWDTLDGTDLGLDEDAGIYRFVTVGIGANLLSIGRSLEPMRELRSIALQALLWTSILFTLLGLLVALYLTHRGRRRMDGWAQALDRVAAGKTDARLPVGRAGDDVDEMSGRINTVMDRLSASFESMRQVSADIAHDLKTPLNRLTIQLEEAADASRAGACVADQLDESINEAQGINQTFEALLRIAQIESGASRSRFRHFDLADVVQGVAEIYQPVAEDAGLALQVNISPHARLPLLGERALISQQLVNLLENAINHASASHSAIVLSAGASEDDGQVWFSVADGGPGIPKAERNKVFRRLYRLEQSRSTPGTGLGLSLVKAIADLHCGKVQLGDNRPGLKVLVTFDRNCPLEA